MEKALRSNIDEEYVGIIKEIKTGVAHVMTLRRTKGVITDRKKFDFELDLEIILSIHSFHNTTLRCLKSLGMFMLMKCLHLGKSLEASIEQFADHVVSIILISDVLQ